MEVSVKFTAEELMYLSRALAFGIIHTTDEKESERMRTMDKKIQLLGAVAVAK